jgi:hypothetical protein
VNVKGGDLRLGQATDNCWHQSCITGEGGADFESGLCMGARVSNVANQSDSKVPVVFSQCHSHNNQPPNYTKYPHADCTYYAQSFRSASNEDS